MTKRKYKKKSTKKNNRKSQSINYKLINSILAIIIVLILAIILIIYTTDTKKLKESKELSKKVEKTIKTEISKVEEKSKEELDKYFQKMEIKKDQFEEYTKDLYEEYVDKEHEKDIKIKEEKTTTPIKNTEIKKQIKEKIKETKPLIKPSVKKVIVKDTPLAVSSNKPKLAIIIDDVTTQYQLNQIKKIGYIVTPSLMPPTPNHANSAKISKNLPFYMIHFPLQASRFSGEEKNTLHINDSYEKIEKRVAQVRKWYPNAKYTNNHTGSKFTSNEKAMDRLFHALTKYDFVFMDSRTTAKTVAKKMAKKYNMPYIVRNVFLDNEQDFAYIQNQLKKAIRIAKKNGQAIAICHPHSMTMKVLRESKHLLKDLELVYLNQLPSIKNN